MSFKIYLLKTREDIGNFILKKLIIENKCNGLVWYLKENHLLKQ